MGCQLWTPEIVKLLLERNDVNPDSPDRRGRAPCFWAIEYYHIEVLEILLKRHDVNPGRADDEGWTPLSWASDHDYEEAVEMLLERNNVNPATASGLGQAPSPVAAGGGYVGTARMAPRRSDVPSNLGNVDVQPQLSWDSMFGHGEIVDMSSEQNDISPDQIPATWSGYEGDVDKLLEWNDASCETTDQIGVMAFPWAPGGASEAIPERLFEQNNVNPNPAHPFSQTPSPQATENESARVAQLVQDPYDLFGQLPSEGGFSEPFSAEPSETPEPPLKRIRRL